MLHQIDEIAGIGLHLDLVLRKVQDAYLRKFRQLDVDLTIEQWVILHQIYKLGKDASQRDIVQSNFRNRATISRVLAGLERKNWVNKTRFKGDQKRFRLELTREGQEIVAKVLPEAKALRQLAIANLDTQDFETFLQVLDTIAQNYNKP